jgi:hypothetical protein
MKGLRYEQDQAGGVDLGVGLGGRRCSVNFRRIKVGLEVLLEDNNHAYQAWADDEPQILLAVLQQMANDAAIVSGLIEEARDKVGRGIYAKWPGAQREVRDGR